MMQASDILKMLVGLHEVGDLDLITKETVLSSICKTDDQPKVLAMATIVQQLMGAFDYENSPEFSAAIDGKSAAFQAMQRKLLTPDKLEKLRTKFADALAELLVSAEVYKLLPSSGHASLDKLKTLASSIQS
jgi:hypothetical protein